MAYSINPEIPLQAKQFDFGRGFELMQQAQLNNAKLQEHKLSMQKLREDYDAQKEARKQQKAMQMGIASDLGRIQSGTPAQYSQPSYAQTMPTGQMPQGMTGVMMREQGQQMPQPQLFGENILQGNVDFNREMVSPAIEGKQPTYPEMLQIGLRNAMAVNDGVKVMEYAKALQEIKNKDTEYFGGLTSAIDESTQKPIYLANTKSGVVPVVGYSPPPKEVAQKTTPVLVNGVPKTLKVPGTNEVKILMSDGTLSSGGSIPIPRLQDKERPEQYWPNDGLTGQPFLDTMPTAMASRVKSIAGGRSKLPSYAAMRRDPTLAKIVEAVYKYDPSYEEQRFGNRYFAQKSYLPGQKNGMLILSNASALGHMDVLQEAYDAMKNGDLKTINSIANRYKVQTGSAPEAVFNAIKGVIGAEVMKSIVPGGGGVVEREEVRETLSREYSPEQFMGTLGGYRALMQEQYDNMRQDYERNDLDPKLWPTYLTHKEKLEKKVHGNKDGKTSKQDEYKEYVLERTKAYKSGNYDLVRQMDSMAKQDGLIK